MQQVLVVGAGLAGAVYARVLAEYGLKVHVIDQRDHIAGNCHDEIDDETGVRFHTYGPHLFHTSNHRVVEWLSRFTDWLPYEHRVVARLESGQEVPLPVNRDTVNAVFGTRLATVEEVMAFLAGKVERRKVIATAEDHLYAHIGPTLTNFFFRPYTRKMWGLDLQEMDAAVVRRLQIRMDSEDRYFPNDTFQALPAKGYTAMFRRIFDHPEITVETGQPFAQAMLSDYDFCFSSMPIDAFYGYQLGELPYRSVRFQTSRHRRDDAPGHTTINYTDEGPNTRETWWHALPGHDGGGSEVLTTVEEPCDYRDNGMERYYPVKAHDGRYDKLYDRYRIMADAEEKLTFIGRCGTYQYLDMHQVVNQSLTGAGKWLRLHMSNAA
ncbi:UDP-galactopyranose mutase [Algicella marina]|uniref:NAD(P)-binding protein n=1 Tax=Algicella marina TaxID=2683284 RepID=A0A6P1T146_9RHOB|nr:UDP-galactopyranose mutase [Algicella marina]QHQ36458.1 NAD(P)-binding protein [Algicella marina]